MRVGIVRRSRGASFSMDVYADGIVNGLKAVRPTWEIVELTPKPQALTKTTSVWSRGIQQYYERYWRYPSTVEQQNVDLFHIVDHSDSHLVYWLQRTSKPVIVTCHDLINFVYPENLYNQARLPLVSMAAWKFAVRGMHGANRVIAVSANTARDIVQQIHLEPDRILVVPDAVEPLFHPWPQTEVDSFRQQHRLLPETMCLLNVGSNHPRKNVSTILRVVAALRARVPIHFWKTGADFTTEQKTFIQTCGLDSFVTYLGKPDKDTLVQIYNAADVLLAPSLYEGFGMTVLEAMASGTPVITSNLASLPEVAGDAAILVDPLDIQEMVEAVCRLQSDAVYRNSLTNKGLARARLFTWEKTATQIAAIYEGLVCSLFEKQLYKVG